LALLLSKTLTLVNWRIVPQRNTGIAGSEFNVQGSKLGIALMQFIKDRNTLNIELSLKHTEFQAVRGLQASGLLDRRWDLT
jgi:hypothetical protein